MLKSLLTASLLVAAPASVFAQTVTNTTRGSSAGQTSAASPGPTGNLSNPQEQANMAGQPSLAHTVPSAGDAKRMPVPVANGQKSSPIPQPDKPPAQHIIR